VGGVSEGPTRTNTGEILCLLVIATVEGTLVFGIPAAFAGCRESANLDRSGTFAVGLVSLQAFAPMTTGVLWTNEEGNVVSVRKAHALDVEAPTKRLYVAKASEDTSFTRSRDPCTSFSTSHSTLEPSQVRRRKPCGLGKCCGQFGIAVGQTRASERNRRRGRIERTNARLAARHRFANKPAEVVRDASETEGGYGHRPARKREPRARRPYVGMQLQKSTSSVWPRISSHAALQKEWR